MFKTYILILKLNNNLSIDIGKMKNINFELGYYIYVGSGKRNIEKRVLRHINKNKKIHWHIDYLTTNKNFEVKRVYYIKNFSECEIAKLFYTNNFNYIKNFGSSDCKCPSHLFFVKDIKKLNSFLIEKEVFYEKVI